MLSLAPSETSNLDVSAVRFSKNTVYIGDRELSEEDISGFSTKDLQFIVQAARESRQLLYLVPVIPVIQLEVLRRIEGGDKVVQINQRLILARIYVAMRLYDEALAEIDQIERLMRRGVRLADANKDRRFIRNGLNYELDELKTRACAENRVPEHYRETYDGCELSDLLRYADQALKARDYKPFMLIMERLLQRSEVVYSPSLLRQYARELKRTGRLEEAHSIHRLLFSLFADDPAKSALELYSMEELTKKIQRIRKREQRQAVHTFLTYIHGLDHSYFSRRNQVVNMDQRVGVIVVNRCNKFLEEAKVFGLTALYSDAIQKVVRLRDEAVSGNLVGRTLCQAVVLLWEIFDELCKEDTVETAVSDAQ